MEYQILREMFEGEEPKSVFEIGCGGAGLLKDVSDHFGCKVGGMDISKVRMENANNVFPDVKFLIHDLNDPWPLEDKSFDIVFSVCTLAYLLNPELAIKEMTRVGKKVIIAEYHQDNIPDTILKAILSDREEKFIIRDYKKLIEGDFKTSSTNRTIIKWPK